MGRSGHAVRFSRYTALSFVTVPVGYALLLLAREVWAVNAGLLNLGVANVLTVPSFLLYQRLVWHDRKGRSTGRALFSFWQTVMIGALVSSLTIAVVDAVFAPGAAFIVLAGLAGQGIVFVVRYFWLDRVTFTR